MTHTDPGSYTARELASHIQHTKIAVGTTRDEMLTHLQEAVEFGFDAAMVAGSWVRLAAEVLAGTDVSVASALDFPTVGVMTSAGKAAEAAELVRLGAQELDMGVQVGWLKSGDHQGFRDDIAAWPAPRACRSRSCSSFPCSPRRRRRWRSSWPARPVRHT